MDGIPASNLELQLGADRELAYAETYPIRLRSGWNDHRYADGIGECSRPRQAA
jgi:hypothetical protein